MRGFIRIMSTINDKIALILMWFPWVLTVIIVWELFLRNMLNRPTIWAHEVCVMVFAVLTILSGAYTLKEKAHVNMDLFYLNMSDRGKAIAGIVTFPAFFIFAVVLLWLGWDFAVRGYEMSERSISSWGPIIWPIKFTIPLGALLLLLQGIAGLMKDILTVMDKEERKVG